MITEQTNCLLFVKFSYLGIGGRTLSVPLKVNDDRYETFDMGAQFVSPQQFHLMDLLKKLDMDMCRTTKKAKGRVICDFTSGPFCTTYGSFVDAYGLGAQYELTTFLGKVYHIINIIMARWTVNVVIRRFR